MITTRTGISTMIPAQQIHHHLRSGVAVTHTSSQVSMDCSTSTAIHHQGHKTCKKSEGKKRRIIHSSIFVSAFSSTILRSFLR